MKFKILAPMIALLILISGIPTVMAYGGAGLGYVPPLTASSIKDEGDNLQYSNILSIFTKDQEINIKHDEFSLKNIEFSLNSDFNDVSINIKKYKNVKATEQDFVFNKTKITLMIYDTFDIDTTLPGENMEFAVLKVKIEKSWLDDNKISQKDIVMIKIDDEGRSMIVPFYDKIDDKVYSPYYYFEVNDFSSFFVGHISAKQNTDFTFPIDKELADAGEEKAEEEKSSNWLWIILGVILGIIIAIPTFYFIKDTISKKNREVEDDENGK